MSCSEEDEETFSKEEESIIEEVKSNEAPSKKTEEANVPSVIVLRP